MGMDRVKYACHLRVGPSDCDFWSDDYAGILTLVSLACNGAQVRDSVRLRVIDTATGNRASINAATCQGFPSAVEQMLNALDTTQARPYRPGDGRDVVVELNFAAHGATLEQCKEFAREALDEALQAHGMAALTPEAQKFSMNGMGVGDAWFES